MRINLNDKEANCVVLALYRLRDSLEDAINDEDFADSIDALDKAIRACDTAMSKINKKTR